MKKNWLIIALAIIIGIGIIIFTMYLIDMERMKHNYDVVFSTWGCKYTPAYKLPYEDNNEKDNTPIDENVLTTNDVEDSFVEILEDTYTFDAKIEKVNEYNGKYSLLVNGDDTHIGEYWCSIRETTELLDKENNKIEVTSLKEGQNVSITYSGGIMETYPGQIGNVLRVKLLD